MIQYIADQAHFKEVIERVPNINESLWIGTADIKDLYVGERPFLGVQFTRIHGIMNDPFLTDREKIGLERYITNLPDAQTAVHGDLHHGNMIFTDDGKNYYIDLSEFCTGIPWFDIGIIYRQTVQVSPEMEMELYHIDKPLSTAFWNAFVRYYFGTGVNAKDIEQEAIPYANLRILCQERLLGKPSLYVRPYIHKMIGLLPKIRRKGKCVTKTTQGTDPSVSISISLFRLF